MDCYATNGMNDDMTDTIQTDSNVYETELVTLLPFHDDNHDNGQY